MYLVQIFLPLYDNNKQPFPRKFYDDIRNELTGRFGGVTLYRQSPAEGIWDDDTGKISHDELIYAEVMTKELSKAWWLGFKQKLESIFRQDEILLRSFEIELL